MCIICRDVKLRYVAGGMAAVSLAMPTKLWDSAGRACGTHIPVPAILDIR